MKKGILTNFPIKLRNFKILQDYGGGGRVVFLSSQKKMLQLKWNKNIKIAPPKSKECGKEQNPLPSKNAKNTARKKGNE